MGGGTLHSYDSVKGIVQGPPHWMILEAFGYDNSLKRQLIGVDYFCSCNVGSRAKTQDRFTL
jgi:hypothetical protein